ncbi:MAG: anti-sigma factor family protein, partial [Bradyrhizobium sp.]
MTCEEAEVLIHALIDGELDAGHAREVEAHVEGCAHCAALMKDYQEIRQAMDEGRPIWTAAEAFGVPYDDDLRRFIEQPGLEHWADLLP